VPLQLISEIHEPDHFHFGKFPLNSTLFWGIGLLAIMFKKLLPVFAAAFITLSAYAATVALKEDHPDTYTVVKGDTLWDISARFLAKPWLWPEVWQANPQIANPHLIYPGDLISLSYVNGEPRLSVSKRGEAESRAKDKIEPNARSTPIEEIVPPIPLSAIKPFLGRPRLVSEKDYKKLPYVVALEEGRLQATSGQFAYVRGGNFKPGQMLAIVRPSMIYREVPAKYPWSDPPRERTAEPISEDTGMTLLSLWNRIEFQPTFWRSAEVLGYEVMELGSGKITRTGDPSSLLITYSDVEIKAGDKIMPIEDYAYDTQFVPHPPKQTPDNMRVLALNNALSSVGRNQVVALSRGARDGVENGQVYAIFSPGEKIEDRVKYADNDVRTVFTPHKDNVHLPEEFVGHLMIFRTFDRISYGLIMDGIRPVHLYDRAYGPDRE